MGVVVPWTRREQDTLERMRAEGKTYREIAYSGRIPGRSDRAMWCRMSRITRGLAKPLFTGKAHDEEQEVVTRIDHAALALAVRIRINGPVPLLSLTPEERIAVSESPLFEIEAKRVSLTPYAYSAEGAGRA